MSRTQSAAGKVAEYPSDLPKLLSHQTRPKRQGVVGVWRAPKQTEIVSGQVVSGGSVSNRRVAQRTFRTRPFARRAQHTVSRIRRRNNEIYRAAEEARIWGPTEVVGTVTISFRPKEAVMAFAGPEKASDTKPAIAITPAKWHVFMDFSRTVLPATYATVRA